MREITRACQRRFRRGMRRFAPPALLRWAYPPPEMPRHIPPVLCRLWALPNMATAHAMWRTSWHNCVSAARAAHEAYPYDATIRSHFYDVVTKHAALFEA